MAFLDNSGDIILDAVLTDLGRRRMSRGNFRIVKFALGDDEINYELYDKNHASGSAYYDLEILQTPVLEATTGYSSTINHGLMSMTNANLIYMPAIKVNTLVDNAALTRDKVYYLAVNDGATSKALISAFGGANGGGRYYVLQAGKRRGTQIVIETGLDTSEIPATPANRTNYITAYNLADANFRVSVDTRFITSIMGPTARSIFNNGGPSGEANVNFRLQGNPPTTRVRGMRNHQQGLVRAVNNNVYLDISDTKPDTDTSVIAGPRANATALNFDVKTLTSDDYARYGKTNQTISGASGTYRYIDTYVKIMGTFGIELQLPIRIIQKE